MAEQDKGSIIRLSDGHTLRVKESVDELRKRIDAARQAGPLGSVDVSEYAPNGVVVMVGHIITVSPV